MRKQKLLGLFSTSLALIFFFAMASCGGGGGSSSSLSYTGETSQALVTGDNALALLEGAYMGGDMGSFPIPMGSVQSGQGVSSPGSLALETAKILKHAANRIDMSNLASNGATGAVISDSLTIAGTCGGSASFSVTFNDVSGEFSGTFTFASFDECSEVINGRINISGVFEIVQGPQGPEPGEILSMSMSFSALSVSGGEPATIAGEITFTVAGPTETMTIDMLLHDGASDMVFWVHDYHVSVTTGPGYVDVDVSGTFYNPSEGFVTISTPLPLHILDIDGYPSSGIIEVGGALGSKARLIVIDATEFYILVEFGDDDLFDDWDSRVALGPLYWGDL